MNTHWRFRHEGRTLGPYPWPLLLLLHARGSLSDQAQVQAADGGPWMPLREAMSVQAGTPAAALPVPAAK